MEVGPRTEGVVVGEMQECVLHSYSLDQLFFFGHIYMPERI